MGLADDDHSDLPRILEFLFDPLGNIMRQNDGLILIDLLRLHDDTQLTSCLNGIAAGHAFGKDFAISSSFVSLLI